MRSAFVGWVSRLAHLLATPPKRVRRNPPSAQRDPSPGGLRGALLSGVAARMRFRAANPPYGACRPLPGCNPGYVQLHGSRP